MKRRWFQIHLSTALVLLLTTGFLLFLGRDLLRMFEHTLAPDYDERYRGGDQVIAIIYLLAVFILVLAIGIGLEALIRVRERKRDA